MTAKTAVRPATLGVVAAAWIVTVHQMRGMDMGVATDLGSLAFFLAIWLSMMAAMMLPGAAPALVESARTGGGARVALFAGSYLAVWLAVGLLVYAVYQPHGATTAGALTIAAGLYEVTPLKGECRRRCRATVRSGAEFGAYCLGSSAGLMVILVALGVMSVTWMAVITVIVLAQKWLPPKASIDVPLAVAIVALGVLILVVPSTIHLT